ncbi:unnamed protein product [Acanthocheilonema viteae]|uniref:Uncharacterized protein n=1 Tax=Acanthocheilonema viteae TaxID=6277 RepID=A0A498SKD9_ACAVI|nr:unnamed protein product [Acanthocheilonema viteae]
MTRWLARVAVINVAFDEISHKLINVFIREASCKLTIYFTSSLCLYEPRELGNLPDSQATTCLPQAHTYTDRSMGDRWQSAGIGWSKPALRGEEKRCHC